MNEGRRAWLAAFLCLVIYGGLVKTFGVLLNTVTEQCDIMVWQYGNTVSLMIIIGSLSGVFLNPLMKVWSIRYVLMLFGFMGGLGLILAATAATWKTMSLSLILLTGIGTRNSYAILMGTLPRYFDQYYLFACGLVYLGESIGTIVFAPLVQLFLDTYGLRSTVALQGSITLHTVLCGPLLKLSPGNPATRPTRTSSELLESHGCRGYLEAASRWLHFDLFKDFNFISLLVCDLSVCLAWQGWLLYLIPHGLDKGFSTYQASGLAISGGAGFFCGVMIPSLVVDIGYVTDHQLRTAGFFLSAMTFLVDPWVNSFIGQIIISVFCTINLGACYTLSMSFVVKISVNNATQVVAFSMLVSAAGRYFGGLVPGILYDTTGDYVAPFLFIGLIQIIAASVSCLAMALDKIKETTDKGSDWYSFDKLLSTGLETP